MSEITFEKLWSKLTPCHVVLATPNELGVQNDVQFNLYLERQDFNPVAIVVPEKSSFEDLLRAKRTIKSLIKERRTQMQ